MRRTKAVDEQLVRMCKLELKKQGARGENGRRLQAIISAKEHGIKQVAAIFNISRETLMRWINKFKNGGSDSFAVAKGRGRPSKLSAEQQNKIKDYIAIEGASLSSKKVQNFISQHYKIDLSKATAHRLLKRLGFSYITARPTHYKADNLKKEQFKKKS